MMRRALRSLWLLGQCLIMGALSLVVPKKPGRVVFYPTLSPGSFSGNLKPVFVRMTSTQPRFDCIWLTTSAATLHEIARLGLPARLRGLGAGWMLLRAEAIVLDNIAVRLSIGRFALFQLWHGSGFKHIGLLNSRLRGLRRMLYRRQYRGYALILASSQEDARRKSACFESDRVVVTGSPRNDAIEANESAGDALRLSLGVDQFDRIVFYCPTFRDSGAGRAFSSDFIDRLDAALALENAAFIIKRHPMDRTRYVPDGLRRIFDLTAKIGDAHEVLAMAEVLVSDYSGIVTDFATTGRPIIFFVHDYEQYVSSDRALYYDLKAVAPGPFVETEQELLACIVDRSWHDAPEYRSRYDAFRARFHSFSDAGSTARAIAAIVSVIEKHRPSAR